MSGPLRHLRVAIVAGAVVAGSIIAPVATWPQPAVERAPVPAEMQVLPIQGVDADAVADSAVAMANWGAGESSTQLLGLAPVDHDHAHEAVARPLRPALATKTLSTDDFGLVGVSTREPLDDHARVLVRVRQDDGWSAWAPLAVTDHGPDADSLEAQGVRFGTEPLVVDDADGVQVRIDTPGGEAPEDARVVLLDTPVSDEDAAPMPQVDASVPIATVAAATVSAPMPPIITREQWGADESARRGAPSYSGTIKAAFLHHTVTSNDYAPEQAMAQVRNLYAWYTKGLRYSDMAYNFLVDRFGRIYEGRAGGVDRAVIGAHTAGFNQESFAVSAIGNFQKAGLPAEQMATVNESVAQLMAWKLSMHHRDPAGSTTLVSDSSSGTSKVKAGSTTTAAVISGHGDIGSTACPGVHLRPQVPVLRSLVASKMGVTTVNPSISAAVPWGSGQALTLSTTSTAPLAWTVAIASRCGSTVRTLSGQQEAAGPLSVAWDGRGDDGQPVPPGTYTFTLNGSSGGDAIYPWTGAGVITSSPGSPPDPCGPPASFSIAGSGWGHGVGLSQYGAYGQALEGRDATTIVQHYYTGAQVTPVQDDMDIRVNLLHQVPSAQMRSEAVDAGGGAIEVTIGDQVVVGGPGDTFAFSIVGASVAVRRITGGQGTDIGSAGTITIRWAGTRNPGTAAGPATLVNVVGPGQSLTSKGHRYRYGTIDITAANTSSGVRMNVVNSVRLHDEYLYGIAEMPSSWPDAALQAQVIAARSYALAKLGAGVRKACNCHVDDGGGPYTDQTFAGWAKQSDAQGSRWTAAVNATHSGETQGLALLHNGAPVSAFYTSSTGGRTQSVDDVWGGVLPYVVSVDDRWSLIEANPNRAWNTTVSQAAAAKAFGVPGVWQIAVAERHESGAAKTLAATLQDGSQKTISASTARSAFGLKSTYINAIDGSTGAPTGAAPAAPAPTAPAPVPAPVAAASLTMKIGPTKKPREGASVRFSGRLSSGAKGVVVERQMLDNGQWVTKASTKTKKRGQYRFTIKKAVPAGTTYRYRVVAMNNGQVIASSPEKTITVRPRR